MVQISYFTILASLATTLALPTSYGSPSRYQDEYDVQSCPFYYKGKCHNYPEYGSVNQGYSSGNGNDEWDNSFNYGSGNHGSGKNGHNSGNGNDEWDNDYSNGSGNHGSGNNGHGSGNNGKNNNGSGNGGHGHGSGSGNNGNSNYGGNRPGRSCKKGGINVDLGVGVGNILGLVGDVALLNPCRGILDADVDLNILDN